MALSIESIERMGREDFLQFRVNAARLAKEGSAAQKKAAGEAVRLLEDLSDTSRIKIAFRGVKIGVRERKMFDVLARTPGATGAALTQAMGWKTQSWATLFGTLARDRLQPLLPPPEGSSEEESVAFYLAILVAGDAQSGFTLHDHARAALAEVGLLVEAAAEPALA